MKRRGLLEADPVYREQMHSYTLRDTGCAFVYYVCILAVYYSMGRIQVRTGRYLGVPVSIGLMLIPVILCRKCISKTGLSFRNIRPSLIVSFIIGLLFLLSFTIIPGIVGHAQLQPAGQILSNILYYFVIIALSEEISFRGFIQPRLYPLLRREWLTIAAGGLLFVFMHYPYQMAARNMTAAQCWPMFIANAPMQFIWHLMFTFLYRRYGNIFGSTVLHGCVDMSMGIFLG